MTSLHRTAEFEDLDRIQALQRQQEAFVAGCAPAVVLEACHISALEFVDLEALKTHAVPQ